MPEETSKTIDEILCASLERIEKRRRERRHLPRSKTPGHKVVPPSRLAALDGSRTTDRIEIRMRTSKPPKRRFEIGDRFQYDGGVWQIIYMYRLVSRPGEWLHLIEEMNLEVPLPGTDIIVSQAFEALGAGKTTPRIVWDEFYCEGDVRLYFSDIYRCGSGAHLSTAELLGLKKM